jgi:hypothetical protein
MCYRNNICWAKLVLLPFMLCIHWFKECARIKFCIWLPSIILRLDMQHHLADVKRVYKLPDFIFYLKQTLELVDLPYYICYTPTVWLYWILWFPHFCGKESTKLGRPYSREGTVTLSIDLDKLIRVCPIWPISNFLFKLSHNFKWQFKNAMEYTYFQMYSLLFWYRYSLITEKTVSYK